MNNFTFKIFFLTCLFGLFTPHKTTRLLAATSHPTWIIELAPLQGLWGHPSLRTELPLGESFSIGLGYSHYKTKARNLDSNHTMQQATEYRGEFIWHPYSTDRLSFNLSLGAGGNSVETTKVFQPPRNRFGENQDPFSYREHIRAVVVLQALTLRLQISQFWTVGLRGEVTETLSQHSRLSWDHEIQYTGEAPPREKKSEFGSPSLSLKLYTGLAI